MKLKTISVSFLMLPFLAYAEELFQDEITVSVTRLPDLATSKLAVMSKVSHEDITKNNSHSLVDVVELLPGIQVNASGGRGQAASINLRGGPANDVLILIDGNPLRFGLGNINASTLPVSAIERVELIKGARATFYGADAVDGVINIVTKPNFVNRQQAKFSYSSYSTFDFDAVNTFLPSPNDIVKVALGISDSSGYNVHPVKGVNDGSRHGLKERNLNLSYTHAFENGLELYTMYNYLDYVGEYDNSWGQDAVTNENEVGRHLFLLNTKFVEDFYSFDFGLSFNHNNEYDHDKEQSKLSFGSSIIKSENFSTHFVNTFRLLSTLKYGIGLDYEHGELKKDSTTGYSYYGESDIVMLNKAIYNTITFEDGIWVLDASFRLDDNSVYGSKNTWASGVGVDLSKLFFWGIHFGTAYRAPNFVELYYPWYGNRELKPEKSKNIEINIRGEYINEYKFAYYINPFFSKYDDMIGADENFCYINISKASNRGVEFGLSFGQEWLLAKAEAVWSRPKNDSTNHYLVNRSKQVYSLSLDGDYNDFDYLALFKHHTKRYINNYSNVSLPSYSVLNIGAGYSFMQNMFRLGFKVDNVFDKEYDAVYGYPASGRVYSFTFALQNLY